MKYKLKEIDVKNISFTSTYLQSGTLLNIKYNKELFDFQTPKVILDSVIQENGHEYLVLKVLGTQASKLFCSISSIPYGIAGIYNI